MTTTMTVDEPVAAAAAATDDNNNNNNNLHANNNEHLRGVPSAKRLGSTATVHATTTGGGSAKSRPKPLRTTTDERDQPFIFQPPGHPKQSIIDGEIWPPSFLPVNVRTAKTMELDPTDVVICTYPKCGTTWMQQICLQLLRRDVKLSKGKELFLVSPMIERMGAAFASQCERPRILKSHLSHFNVPKSDRAKYIFLARNPKDCLTSYFFHNRNFKIYDWANGDFGLFFELFVNGQLAFGDYFDHLLTWLPHLDAPNVLFLTYESMIADLEGSIRRVGHFLGGTARRTVENERELRRVVANCTLQSMKVDQSRWFPEDALRAETFIRKGSSRDWKNYFTAEQSARIDLLFHTRLAGTRAESWWPHEMRWTDPEPRCLSASSLSCGGDSATSSTDSDDEHVSISRRPSIHEDDDEEGEDDQRIRDVLARFAIGPVPPTPTTPLAPGNIIIMPMSQPPQPIGDVEEPRALVHRQPSFASVSTGYGSMWNHQPPQHHHPN